MLLLFWTVLYKISILLDDKKLSRDQDSRSYSYAPLPDHSYNIESWLAAWNLRAQEQGPREK